LNAFEKEPAIQAERYVDGCATHIIASDRMDTLLRARRWEQFRRLRSRRLQEELQLCDRILELRLFRYALRSAEHGSFRRAAAAINIQ
jgi:hypothetical protein